MTTTITFEKTPAGEEMLAFIRRILDLEYHEYKLRDHKTTTELIVLNPFSGMEPRR
jgi:hypothetical protein